LPGNQKIDFTDLNILSYFLKVLVNSLFDAVDPDTPLRVVPSGLACADLHITFL